MVNEPPDSHAIDDGGRTLSNATPALALASKDFGAATGIVRAGAQCVRHATRLAQQTVASATSETQNSNRLRTRVIESGAPSPVWDQCFEVTNFCAKSIAEIMPRASATPLPAMSYPVP